jgi:NADPH-dependent 2,4-dienoyl-CoA reductase/sulfur reductase-like enzyme/nitrite reductase/ring-hydroxylating ferredoxin subunit
MSDTVTAPNGPDLATGVPLSRVTDGTMLLGHANGEPVLLARRGDELFAVGAHCPHYGAPLGDGLLVDDTVRCPWHHACFSLRTGEALRAPALDPISCWRVEQRDGIAYVRERLERAAPQPPLTASSTPGSVVIVGGGAAGNAAAEMLRRQGYAGRITMLSADAFGPCDRPNLSKGYLAGTAPAESNPLRSPDFYREHDIDLKLNARVTAIDTASRQVRLADGTRHPYDALLLATGAEPVRLGVPGSDLPHVHYLRTLADGHALVARALASQRAVVIGASFIGLEVTASLRARGIAVHVVAPDTVPMQKILGLEVGRFVRRLHEQHGVTFHLGTTAASIDERGVTLQTGEYLPADFVVVGIGVRPALSLAEQAGLAIDRGVTVDEHLQTSIPGIYAAGDIARWPDRLTGDRIRVEHWVVAERQGQTAARNMLGQRERFDAVPFFWTEQYDFSLAYVGHAEHWNEAELDGRLDADTRDCTITYRRGDKKLAVALVHRDLEGLRAEVEFERTTEANPMKRPFKVGDHVIWNSEAGRVSGRIIKVHTRDADYKGYTRHASRAEPQYEIKSDKTDHIAMHKGSALERLKF